MHHPTPAAAAAAAGGAGVGRGSDSGIDGADFSGTTVTVFGPENSATDAGAMVVALNEFGASTGIHIDYTGARDFEEQINAQVESDNPPDIAIFPQPGKLAGFARSGDLFALPDDVLANVSANWAPDLDVVRERRRHPVRRARASPTSSRSCGTSRRRSPSTATTCRRRSTSSTPSPTR